MEVMSVSLGSPAVEAESRPALTQRPIWILSGQLGVLVAVVMGFGALGPAKPKLLVLLLLVCVGGLVMLGPAKRIGRIIVAAPTVAIVTWWIASYFWTFNIYGWRSETQNLVPLIVAFVVLVSLLPGRYFQSALAAGCYAGIGYTVLQLIVHPGAAMVNPDGVPGWRGGFIHKNAMGPFMLFAVLAIASFDRPSWRRRIAIFVALVLIVMSKSTTTIAAGFVVLIVYLVVTRLSVASSRASATIILGALGAVMLVAGFFSYIGPALLGISGEDPTLSRRTDIWAGVIEAIDKRPWIGYGAGGVWGNPNAEPGRSIRRNLGFHIAHAHNGFLEILLILGIVGLALFVWLQLATIRLAIRNLRTESTISRFVISYIVLTIMLSIVEVAFLGIWLALLCAFNCWMLGIDLRRRRTVGSLPTVASDGSTGARSWSGSRSRSVVLDEAQG